MTYLSASLVLAGSSLGSSARPLFPVTVATLSPPHDIIMVNSDSHTGPDAHPEPQLLRGLQEAGVPLVPPPKLLPQELQLAQEGLYLLAAGMLGTDQAPPLLVG